MRNRTPRQILGDDLHTQLIFEGYEVVSQNALADARSQAYEEQSKITNEMIIAVVHRAEDFGIALKDWQANALVCAAHEGRKK